MATATKKTSIFDNISKMAVTEEKKVYAVKKNPVSTMLASIDAQIAMVSNEAVPGKRWFHEGTGANAGHWVTKIGNSALTIRGQTTWKVCPVGNKEAMVGFFEMVKEAIEANEDDIQSEIRTLSKALGEKLVAGKLAAKKEREEAEAKAKAASL